MPETPITWCAIDPASTECATLHQVTLARLRDEHLIVIHCPEHDKPGEFKETQLRRRGHRFLPPAAQLRAIPRLYATERQPGPIEAKTIWCHWFVAGGSGDWWLAELDQDEWIGFGYADLGHGEWGQFSLTEMEQVAAHGGLVIVERDLDWQPVRFDRIARRY